jgi:hypothetical protein
VGLIVYPIVLWLVAFGSYLLGARHEAAVARNHAGDRRAPNQGR